MHLYNLNITINTLENCYEIKENDLRVYLYEKYMFLRYRIYVIVHLVK